MGISALPIKFGGGYQESDYVRIKCFELAVKEIRKRNVRGSVAEVGVFRGEFAQYINHAFQTESAICLTLLKDLTQTRH